MNTEIPNEQNFFLTLRPKEELAFDLKSEILRFSDLPEILSFKFVSKYWKEASKNTLKIVGGDWKIVGENKEVWQVVGRLLRLPSIKFERNLVKKFIGNLKAKELINSKSTISDSFKKEMNELIKSDKVEDIYTLRKFHKAAPALNFWVPLLESQGCELLNRVSALDFEHDGNQIHKLLIELSKRPNAKPFLFGYNEISKKPFMIISYQDAAHNELSGIDPSTKSFIRIYNVDSKIEPLITKYKFEKSPEGELKLSSSSIHNLDHQKIIEHIITTIKGTFEEPKGV